MTETQTLILKCLRHYSFYLVAEAAERYWAEKRRYYLDPRLAMPSWLRRLFREANAAASRHSQQERKTRS